MGGDWPGRFLAVFLALSLFVPWPALSQSPVPASDAVAAVGSWPRPIQAGDTVVEVYQPRCSTPGKAIVSRRAPRCPSSPRRHRRFLTGSSGSPPAPRSTRRRVSSLSRTSRSPRAASSSAEDNDLLRLIRQHVPAGVKVLGLAQVEANLAVAQAKQKAEVVPVKNDPPQIMFSPTPALLIRIDGSPSLRQVPGSSLLRVINTRSLILLDSATGQYYLHVFDRWLDAPAPTGPWVAAGTVSPALESARQAAVSAGQVDLLERPPSGQGALPMFFVSTAPTELIETNGPPDWSPIPGTELLYVTNTSAHIFLELKTQLTYVLLSGRWFRARSTSGPWQYVAPNQLPADFARIPETHPQGVILASVAGTSQAQEAVIANTIPQTGTVSQ